MQERKSDMYLSKHMQTWPSRNWSWTQFKEHM